MNDRLSKTTNAATTFFRFALSQVLGDKLRDYMRQRDYNANQALKIIISRFFTGK